MKVDFRHMSPDLDLHDGYNRREKQQRSRVNRGLPTFDGPIGHFGISLVRWRGSVIQFARTRVAKRHSPPKKQELNFVEKTVLNVDMALLLEKIHLGCL